MELFKASHQWAIRPPDERFESLEELHKATAAYRASAATKEVPFSDLRVEPVDGEVQLLGKLGIPAKFTHWAFGQLCSKIEAPASYLRDLPATLAAQNLNHGLAKRVKEAVGRGIASLLFHNNGGMLLRALLTDSYERIWNCEVAERLLYLQGQGWAPSKPTVRFDGGNPAECQACGGSGLSSSEAISNGGSNPNGTGCLHCKGTGKALPSLYASDHDLFAFLSNRDITVDEFNSTGAIYRGIIVENSEVGASALKLTRFLYREMCGNHIIWGASDVVDLSVRHIGDARHRWGRFVAEVRRYSQESVSDLEAKIAKSKTAIIADTKEEVLDALFGKRNIGLSRATLESGYTAVNPEQDGDPRSKWGIVQGLTRYSQTIPFADKRTVIDKAAGKILDAEF